MARRAGPQEAWFPHVVHHGDCISWPGGRVSTSGWLTSREAGWRESATPASPGTESIPSFGVCLSLFSSSAAAAKVQSQMESLVYTYDHPTGPTPSSIPSPVPVPEIRGGAGYFLDFSTSGEEQIFSPRETWSSASRLFATEAETTVDRLDHGSS